MECRTIALALLSSIAIGVLGTACASQAHAQGPTRQRLSEAGTVTLSQQLDAARCSGARTIACSTRERTLAQRSAVILTRLFYNLELDVDRRTRSRSRRRIQ